jgi:hypothetical protein
MRKEKKKRKKRKKIRSAYYILSYRKAIEVLFIIVKIQAK